MFDIFNDTIVASVATTTAGTHLSFPAACGGFSFENLPLTKSKSAPFVYDLPSGYEYALLTFRSEKQEDQNSLTHTC
ncbi:hypothetical protein [Anaplasma phagocytophilum]|uniref:hypothetical protein n=1 Tax=Anaplasma phagocytophilum TaxID=948 RepID=UPI00201A6843